jgi:hypothetical protein
MGTPCKNPATEEEVVQSVSELIAAMPVPGGFTATERVSQLLPCGARFAVTLALPVIVKSVS